MAPSMTREAYHSLPDENGDSTVSFQMQARTIEKEADEAAAETERSVTNKEEYMTGFKLGLILVSVTIVCFLMMLDMSILATAIPYITDDFHSLLDVGWYGSAYQLACAALQPLTGKVYTHLSSKWSFLAFFLLFEVGSAICGAAVSSSMLIIGRAVAGLGGSGLMNGGLTILSSSVPPHRQPALLGIMMALGYLGIALGPLIGGALTQYVSWRWCFYINLPVGGVVAILLLMLNVPDQVVKPGWRKVLGSSLSHFDLIGFSIFAPAAAMFFLALQYGGNQYPWKSATVIGLFCGAAVTFVLFFEWERRQGDDAMIPFSMVRNRIVWSSSLTMFFFSGSVFITGYYLPIYFQAVLGATPIMSGVDILPNILTQMVMTMVAGRLLERFGYYLPFILICGVLNAVASGLLTLLSPTTSTGRWVGYQIILGVGRGMGLTMPILAIQNILPKPQIPVAMSVLVFTQNLGGAIFVAFAQAIFTNSLRQTIPKAVPSVSPDAIIAAGPNNMRNLVPADRLENLLGAYSTSIDHVFFLGLGIAVAALLISSMMGWKDIRKKDGMNESTDRQS